MMCRTFWWGFHVEICAAAVLALTSHGLDRDSLAREFARVPIAVVSHVTTLSSFISDHIECVKAANRGAGVCVSMSWFAPDLYVVTGLSVPTSLRTKASTHDWDCEASDMCAFRM